MWVPYCLPTKLVNLLARSPQMECKQSAKEAANKATNCQNRKFGVHRYEYISRSTLNLSL